MGHEVRTIEQLVSIDIRALSIIVSIVSLEVIGICQWFKNFVKCKKGRFYALLSVIVLLPCAYMNTPLVSSLSTTLFNIYFLSLAVIQLSYEIIIQKFPQAVGGFFDKMVSKVGVHNGTS